MGLEGIVSKQRDRTYKADPWPHWINVKNSTSFCHKSKLMANLTIVKNPGAGRDHGINATIPVRTMNENKTPQLHLVPTGVGNEPRRHRRGRAYLEAFVGIIVLSAVSFYAALGLLRGKNSVPPSGEITTVTPMADAIIQNTPGQSEGYAFGMPEGFEWCAGSYKPAGSSTPPSDFTAVTGKGQVYPEAGTYAYSSPNGSVTIANAKTYIHLGTAREWVLVQDQATDGIAGDHFFADFSPSPAKQMRLEAQPDGSVVVGAPPAGYNDHFWPIKRGTYAAGSVDAVYVQMEMRTNAPDMKLVASIGADWWRDADAGVGRDFANSSGTGMSNWVKLSTEWSTLRFYSWSTAQLQAEPPPPLAGLETKPTITRRPAKTSPPCLSAP
jgi:hypothetical protein